MGLGLAIQPRNGCDGGGSIESHFLTIVVDVNGFAILHNHIAVGV